MSTVIFRATCPVRLRATHGPNYRARPTRLSLIFSRVWSRFVDRLCAISGAGAIDNAMIVALATALHSRRQPRGIAPKKSATGLHPKMVGFAIVAPKGLAQLTVREAQFSHQSHVASCRKSILLPLNCCGALLPVASQSSPSHACRNRPRSLKGNLEGIRGGQAVRGLWISHSLQG
eukprot:5365735-Prymnesium_polylepis.1